MPAQYAYAADFDSTAGALPEADKTRIEGLLEMASRLYDRASGVAPGHWAPIASTSYTFDARGGELLYLRGEAGEQYLLRTVTANKIEVDISRDASFDYTLDLSDLWVQGFPRNAVANGEAFTALRLVPYTGATLTQWSTVGTVTITGTWGFAATPAAVRWRTVDIAHGLSQRGYAGGYGTDESLQQGGDVPAWVVRLVDASYSYRLPVFA